MKLLGVEEMTGCQCVSTFEHNENVAEGAVQFGAAEETLLS